MFIQFFQIFLSSFFGVYINLNFQEEYRGINLKSYLKIDFLWMSKYVIDGKVEEYFQKKGIDCGLVEINKKIF